MKGIDVAKIAGLMRREVKRFERDGRPAAAVVASRVYDTDVDDLWNAVTDPVRIPRWFLPIEGELRLGGRFQLKGNAGGVITTCAKPHLATTWEFGGDTSWLDVVLSAEGKGARLTLEHTAFADSPHWDQFGPGAVGIGWELGLLGMHLHLGAGGAAVDAQEVMAWTMSDEGKRFQTLSSDGWCAADIASGRDADKARKGAAATLAAYTGG